MFPDDRKYMSSHEWCKVEGDTATIGVSEFAVKQLSDLVFIDLPDVDSDIAKGDSFGEIESVKAVSDVYAPVSGTIVEVNQAVADAPETLSNDAHGAGWLIKIKMSDSSEADGLLDAAAYGKVTEESDH